jgi:hypothetical protein
MRPWKAHDASGQERTPVQRFAGRSRRRAGGRFPLPWRAKWSNVAGLAGGGPAGLQASSSPLAFSPDSQPVPSFSFCPGDAGPQSGMSTSQSCCMRRMSRRSSNGQPCGGSAATSLSAGRVAAESAARACRPARTPHAAKRGSSQASHRTGAIDCSASKFLHPGERKGTLHTLRHYSVRLRRSRRLPYVLARWCLISAVILLALFFIAWR